MVQAIARLFGLGGRKASQDIPRDILVDMVGQRGSRQRAYIKKPSDPQEADIS